MSEDAHIVKWISIAICTIAICLTGSCQNTKYQIRKMVEAGAQPIVAACAIGDGCQSVDAVVAQYFANQEKLR